MTICEIENRNNKLINELTCVWENSVKATHIFLTNEEIKNIKKYVPQALKDVPYLVVIKDNNDLPIAFMGIDDTKLEMLFVKDNERGNGFGKYLLNYGIEKYGINILTVNEQNPAAKDFYKHMGFNVYKRSEVDEQGNPYPILYMKRESPKKPL